MIFIKSKIDKIALLVILIIAIGIIGYMWLSGYNFVDALYMTVITVTTVGFGELQPFSPEEKIFTIFLILTSIIICVRVRQERKTSNFKTPQLQ